MMLSLSIGVMFFISLFSIILEGTTSNVSFIIQDNANNLTVLQDFSFVLDDFYLALGIIIGLIILAGVIGIGVLGTGISGTSIKIIIIALAYISLWVFLTIFSLDLIFSIEIFGILIYFILCFCYLVGIISKLAN